MADPAVRLEGFKEFRRDLKKLEPAVAKDLQKDIKAAAGKVAAAASANAVRDTGPRHGKSRVGVVRVKGRYSIAPLTKVQSPHYADTIKPYVTAKGASVGSRLPQAGVLHFGGTIRPRGVPITFPARPVVSTALDQQTDRIIDEVGDAVEQAARRAGWK